MQMVLSVQTKIVVVNTDIVEQLTLIVVQHVKRIMEDVAMVVVEVGVVYDISFGKCLNPKECCSQYGYCGSSGNYCGTRCQPKYGLCK
jgi:hypothetical protein